MPNEMKNKINRVTRRSDAIGRKAKSKGAGTQNQKVLPKGTEKRGRKAEALGTFRQSQKALPEGTELPARGRAKHTTNTSLVGSPCGSQCRREKLPPVKGRDTISYPSKYVPVHSCTGHSLMPIKKWRQGENKFLPHQTIGLEGVPFVLFLEF